MPALLLALVLATAATEGAPAPAVAPVPVAAPASEVAPVAAPALVADDPATSTPALTPNADAPTSTSTPPAPKPPPPLPQAAVEKLGQGDRAFLAGDYRNALFAYQDAVYIAPQSPIARVRLGRAYLALRYPAQAIAQAEQALAVDPTNAEARRLAEEARNPPARPVATTPASQPASMSPSGSPPPYGSPQATNGTSHATNGVTIAPQPRVFRFTEPEADPAPAPARGPTAVGEAAATPATPAPAPAATTTTPPNGGPRTIAAVAEVDAPERAPAASATAAQLYRAALVHLGNREFEKGAAVLTEAIAADPRLAVAHAARASARFGLGRYRDAAADYRTALELDPKLGTPLYGLAECYRVLGEPRHAAEMYQRYAESRAADVREDLRALAAKRVQELR